MEQVALPLKPKRKPRNRMTSDRLQTVIASIFKGLTAEDAAVDCGESIHTFHHVLREFDPTYSRVRRLKREGLTPTEIMAYPNKSVAQLRDDVELHQREAYLASAIRFLLELNQDPKSRSAVLVALMNIKSQREGL